MPLGGANSERILILAPQGRDAKVASELLRAARFSTLICGDVSMLGNEIDRGAGLAVVVEDALPTDQLNALAKTIANQPVWSDFPLLILTGHGNAPERNALAMRFQDLLGNVSFLERPFHPTTLISVTRSALRSRRRQYQTRELLDRQMLLTREVQHRTKNLLAIIRAIASTSLQDTSAREAFFDRLQALAKAQDLVIAGAKNGAFMENLVHSVLGAFEARTIVDGPRVFLGANVAQSFALILHELATNATKHGALTKDTGTVSVHWTLDTSEEQPTIIFRWKERGGPPVTQPKHRGFGTILLERALMTFGTRPRFEYSPEGFAYEVRALLAKQHQLV